jgi:hypothetical protein
MNKKSKDEYIVLFQGVKIYKREANKVGIGIIFGFVGALISVLILGVEYKIAGVIICSIFAAVGYFGIGSKISKS